MMENDEYNSVLENLVSGGGGGLQQPTATAPLVDPSSGGVTSPRTGLRPRLTSNSMVPTSGVEHRLTHPRMAHQRSPAGKAYTDFVTRASDDEASNLSVASVLDDHSSFSSEDANALLRDKANGRLQQQKRPGTFVPDVAPGSSISSSESGYLFQNGGDGGDSMGVDDELQQQVPVSKFEELELRILRQPEEQHRARYMSEGSRGSVKDRSGKSHVTVALRGCYRPAVLEIFAAIGSGPVVPHPLYRLIPVTGKNGSSVTSCKEGVTADGAACLQVVLRPENKMTAVLDCIGILKICSYDLKRKLPKQNRSASVRLIFRVTVPAPQDRRQNVILQTVSLPIVCAQQPGYPDVARISCTSSSVRGNVDVFIVGKNFSNNATVQMKEYGPDGKVVWSAQAPVDQQHTHTCHMICTVPPYRDLAGGEAMLTVECGKKVSRPLSFKYLPDNPVNETAASQLQQQMAYNQSYGLGGGTGSSAAGDATNGSTAGNFPGSWTTGTDFASGLPTDQSSQQQQYQQQSAPTGLMPVAPTAILDQSSNHAPLNMTAAGAPTVAPVGGPAVITQTAFGDFLDNSTKPEPMADDQNASFYYSNQYSDKAPAPKRARIGEDNSSFTTTNDPFGFSLEDLPRLLS